MIRTLLSLMLLLPVAYAAADDGEEKDSGGFFVEPMVTLSREDADIKTSQVTPFDDTSGTLMGYGVGAKLGMHVSEAFFLGIDGRFSRAKMDDSSYGAATGNLYNVGVTAGAQMPIVGLRVFATYVPWGAFDPGSGEQGFDVKFEEAKGFRVGAGFRVAMVSLNLEYQKLKYDDTTVESIGAFSPGTSTGVDYETEGWIASVSFPLEL